MSVEVVVRELVGAEQLKAIKPLIRQLNPEIDDATFDERLQAVLEEGGYRCIAAFQDSRMVGIAGFWVGTKFWCGRFIEPDNVVVDKSLRGGGIGQALMLWIEAEGDRLGCLVMKLEAYAERTRTRDFYKRLGYEEPGVVMVKVTRNGAEATLAAIRAKAQS